MGKARQGPVTLQALADHLGLAKGTVSMALRGDSRIAATTAQRVQRAAAELGYDAAVNQSARRLGLSRHGRAAHNRVVAVLAHEAVLSTPYFTRMLNGLYKGLMRRGHAMLMVDANCEEAMAPLTQGEIDGLVSLGHPANLAHAVSLRQRAGFGDRPMVSVVQELEGAACICADETMGTAQAVRALLKAGHRQVLRMGYGPSGRDLANRSPRREAIAATLAAAGLNPACACRTLLLDIPGLLGPAAARRALHAGDRDPAGEALLAELAAHPQTTAILADNDAVALRAWAALHQAGLRVPDDLSIIGFDDTDPMPGPNGENVLASVTVPVEDLGARAADVLVDAVENEAAADIHCTLPTRFVPRASLGPARDFKL